MHWSEKIAEELIANNSNKESYVLAAGISPSGTVHIGNFRDVATIFFVGKALKKAGKKVKLLFSWDEYDRFRKVPKNIPQERFKEYESYLGLPYSEVPDPLGECESYAKRYEREFEESLERMGLKIDIIRYQADEYASGIYKDKIIHSIKKRKEIFDIIAGFKTQEFTDEDREKFYPLSIYCHSCKKDNTKILEENSDSTKLTYTCRCGHKGEVDLNTDTNFKLAWKIDWPMRWLHEEVDFEPGGKDHAAPQGSYQVGKIISKKIFNREAPMFQGYEFIGIKGLTGKMSGSSGLSLNLGELLNVYPGELILWMYAKRSPLEAFNIGISDDVTRIYTEFDRLYAKYLETPEALDEGTRSTLEFSLLDNRKIERVPFSTLTTLYSISNEKEELIESMFKKIGLNYKKEEFQERLKCVAHWLKNYYPEAIIKVVETPDTDYFNSLSEIEKTWVRKSYEIINDGINPETLQSKLFSVAKDEALEDKQNRQNQKKFFGIMYKLLIGKERGPSLASLVMAIGSDNVLPILKPLI